MIPTVEDSPVNTDNLDKITHLHFTCAKIDTVDRLEAWLLRVPNLASLSISGNKEPSKTASTQTDTNPNYRSEPVTIRLPEALLGLSQSLPKLQSLEITECDVSDEALVKFVKMRKESPGSTPLTKLAMGWRDCLHPETHAWLHTAVKTPDGQSGYTHRPSLLIRSACRHCEV
jgi:hypothetical protein